MRRVTKQKKQLQEEILKSAWDGWTRSPHVERLAAVVAVLTFAVEQLSSQALFRFFTRHRRQFQLTG